MLTVPEVLRVMTLNRYLWWSQWQRDHYKEIKITWETDFFDSLEMQRGFMYLSYWYAGLFVVCEGWQEMKLSDPEINKLLSSPYLDVLRRYRNGVFHFQEDYFDKRVKEAIQMGDSFEKWVEELMLHMNRYFSDWHKQHAQLLKKAPRTAPN